MTVGRGMDRRFWGPLAVWGVIAVVVAAAFVYSTLRTRDAALNRGWRRVHDAAALAAEHAARVLEGADSALVAISDTLRPYDWDRIAGDRNEWQGVRAWADRVAAVSRFVALDGNGRLRLVSDVFPTPEVDLSDRPYFQQYKGEAVDRPLIGDPIIGRVSKERSFPLCRSLARPDGSFAGIVNANIPPESLLPFFRSIDVGENGFVSLRREDGVILAREPAVKGVPDPKVDAARLRPPALANAQEATGEVVSPFDGVRRFVAFHRVSGFDVTAVAGMSRSEILDIWLRDTMRGGAILTAALVGLTGLLVALLRRQGRELAARDALLDSETRFRLLFDRMVSGFALHEIIPGPDGKPVDYRFLDVNPAFERLTGLTRAQVVGHAAREVLPDLEPVWVETFGAVATTGTPAQLTEHTGALGKTFEVSAFRSEPGRFACTFIDVSERERKGIELRMAVERLTEQNTELQRFAFVAAHDLQEPLRTIVSFTQLLKNHTQGGLNRECGEFMDTIIDAARHMHDLVRDLQDYSRVTAKDTRFVPVALGDACNAAIHKLGEGIAESGADVDVGPL
ncbi:MAG: PAS domain-containing protein, partial [Alphaproteobacteria bacterium]|nr:PAS domain-containing protein [Alphaproteobacteria bacterium]